MKSFVIAALYLAMRWSATITGLIIGFALITLGGYIAAQPINTPNASPPYFDFTLDWKGRSLHFNVTTLPLSVFVLGAVVVLWALKCQPKLIMRSDGANETYIFSHRATLDKANVGETKKLGELAKHAHELEKAGPHHFTKNED